MAGFKRPQKKQRIKRQPSTSNREEAVMKSLIAYKQGNLIEAKSLMDKAIKIDQANSIELGLLATIEKRLGNSERALQLFEKSVRIDQKNSDILHNYSGLLQDREPIKAIKISDQALKLSPNNSKYLERNGYLRWKSGDLRNALKSTIKAIKLNPNLVDAHVNLGAIYKDLGNLEKALAFTLKSLELKPDNPTAQMNLGSIYQDLGKLDQAVASTLKSLELKPDNPDAHMNLGIIYRDLGQLDQALASTLTSLRLKPEGSAALCKLGQIKMALGKTNEAQEHLSCAIKYNTQECEAYFTLSQMIRTDGNAEELIESIKKVSTLYLTPKQITFIEFALSNCFHRLQKYDQASAHLKTANQNKLILFPSNASKIQQEISMNLSQPDPAEPTTISKNSGKDRIFIVGMPRSGSTLLETILSLNPEIKALGESNSLTKSIAKFYRQKKYDTDRLNLYEIYSQMEPIGETCLKYTVDKQLYNFIYANFIGTHLPAAKIIHCCRNPMDNILSMHRSNLSPGNSYTANLEDAAKIYIAQEQAMQFQKTRHSNKIYTFNYDNFVNDPEAHLRKLQEWLGIEFEERYLHPEKSNRSVITASIVQARSPITNKSINGWKNYKNLLEPALKIFQKNGIKIE